MIDTLLSAAKSKISVNEWREPRPFGSTVAYETMQDIELLEHCVVVRVDADDMLPVECEGEIALADGGCVRLRFSMPQVGLKDGKTVVTYEVGVAE